MSLLSEDAWREVVDDHLPNPSTLLAFRQTCRDAEFTYAPFVLLMTHVGKGRGGRNAVEVLCKKPTCAISATDEEKKWTIRDDDLRPTNGKLYHGRDGLGGGGRPSGNRGMDTWESKGRRLVFRDGSRVKIRTLRGIKT